MAELGEHLSDQLRVSGLYALAPPKPTYPPRGGPPPSLKSIALDALAERFSQVAHKKLSVLPGDLIQSLFEVGIRKRKINNANFEVFVESCPALGSRFVLHNYPSLKNAHLLAALNPSNPAPIFQHLVEVSLRSYPVSDKLLKALLRVCSPTLVSLELHDSDLTNEAGLVLSTYVGTLQKLSIACNFGLDEPTLISIVENSTKLTSLNIAYTNADDSTLKSIAKLSLLTDLNCCTITSTVLTFLGSLNSPSPLVSLAHTDYEVTSAKYERIFPKLRDLGLIYPESPVENLITWRPDLFTMLISDSDYMPTETLGKCTRLRALGVQHMPDIDVWRPIYKSLSLLTRLVATNYSFDDEYLKTLMYFTELRTLKMKRSGEPGQFSVDSFRRLLKALPELTELEVKPLYYEALEHIHTDAPKLKRLKFNNCNCANYTLENRRSQHPDGVFAYLPSLEKLSVEDDSAELLHFRTPNLTRLCAHTVSEETSLAEMVEGAPLLRYVKLSPECPVAGLYYLAKASPLIEDLDVNHLKGSVTDAHMALLGTFRFLQHLCIDQVRESPVNITWENTLPLLKKLEIIHTHVKELKLQLASLEELEIRSPPLASLSLKAKKLHKLTLNTGQLTPGALLIQAPNIRRITYTFMHDHVFHQLEGLQREEQKLRWKKAVAEFEALWKHFEKSLNKQKVDYLRLRQWHGSSFAISWPNLKLLEVSSSNADLPYGSKVILRTASINCPLMEDLEVSSEGLFSVDLKPMPSIRQFTIDAAMNYHAEIKAHPSKADRFIHTILSTAPTAEDFSLICNPAEVTPAGWRLLLRHMTHIKTLYVRCPQDIAGFLEALVENIPPNLESVRIWRNYQKLGEEQFPAIDAAAAKLIAARYSITSAGNNLIPVANAINADGQLPSVYIARFQ